MLLLWVLFCVGFCASAQSRAKALLQRMTLQEKISMLHGSKGPYVGQTAPNSRLGIPSLQMEDGPQGVADGVKNATAWPSALTIAQSWDLNLFGEFAGAMGRQQRAKGTGVLLGPMMNLARVAEGGRCFEGLGEDPFLASRMAETSVRSIQNEGVMACAKHYINNDFDSSRFNISIQIDEDTQFLYLQPFAAAVNAGVLSVMCSYNRVNKVFACENNYTLALLKQQLNFSGFVVSDWGAVHSTVPSALAGLDVEMGGAEFFSDKLLDAVKSGQVPESLIDDKVLRVLSAMFSIGIFDNPNNGTLSTPVNSPAYDQLARKFSAGSTVLAKNGGNLLPLSPNKKLKIVLLGSDALVAGGGSGFVISSPSYVSALEGLSQVSSNWTVSHKSLLPFGIEDCKHADVCIGFVGSFSHEGSDRSSLDLSELDLLLVDAIAKSTTRSIIVIQSAAPVLLPFLDSVSSVLVVGFAGQSFGLGLADVVSGKTNPSAKFAMTWPKTNSDKIFSPQQWPGVEVSDPCINECKRFTHPPYHQAVYSEGPYFGYRYFDLHKVQPVFPFGFGLSYTNFSWSNFAVSQAADAVNFSLLVSNVGTVTGKDVVQIYVSFPAKYTTQPIKQLKAFQMTSEIAPSSSFSAVLSIIPSRDLLVWQTGKGAVQANGNFVAYIARDAFSAPLATLPFSV